MSTPKQSLPHLHSREQHSQNSSSLIHQTLPRHHKSFSEYGSLQLLTSKSTLGKKMEVPGRWLGVSLGRLREVTHLVWLPPEFRLCSFNKMGCSHRSNSSRGWGDESLFTFHTPYPFRCCCFCFTWTLGQLWNALSFPLLKT